MCVACTHAHTCVCVHLVYIHVQRESIENPDEVENSSCGVPSLARIKKEAKGFFFFCICPLGLFGWGGGSACCPGNQTSSPFFFYVCCCKSSPPLGGSVRFRSSTAATTKLYIHTVCVCMAIHTRAPPFTREIVLCVLFFFFFNGGGVLLFEWNPNRIRRWPELATQDIHLSRSRAKMVSNFPQYSITSLYDC